MFKQRRGFVPGVVIPLAIGLAIALVIVISVTIPAVNASLYNGTATTFTGTTGTITGNVLPLIALVGLVLVGGAVMSILGKND